MSAKSMFIVQQIEIAAKRLSLVESNLRHVKAWAEQNDNQHLENGAVSLLSRLEQVSEDVRSLASILREQAGAPA